MLCNPADKNVMTYGAQAPSIKWSLSAGRSCLGIWGLHIETMMVFMQQHTTCCLSIKYFRCVWYHLSCPKKPPQIFAFFPPKLEQFCIYQIGSSNWIGLLKLISLVNICPCAGLKGLIRPGTWRPPGSPSSVCAWRTRTVAKRLFPSEEKCELRFHVWNFRFNVTDGLTPAWWKEKWPVNLQ